VHAGEGHRGTDAQGAAQAGCRAPCCALGFIGLFKGAPGALEKRQAGFGGGEAAG